MLQTTALFETNYILKSLHTTVWFENDKPFSKPTMIHFAHTHVVMSLYKRDVNLLLTHWS